MQQAQVEVSGRKVDVVYAAREQGIVQIDPVRWNVGHSDAFDVHLEHLEAQTLVYDWVSRFLQCPVKRVFKNQIHVPSVHLGSFLNSLEELTLNDRLEDMRNIRGGKEKPPVYDVIELNSETTRDFLIEGIQFFERKTGTKYVIERSPSWSGMYFTVYTTVKDREHNAKLCADAWDGATTRSFLKGAAFSISGKFLKRKGETWDDVFLDAKQQKPLERLVQTINERGAEMANRGVVLMGPPGTGKTLAARVVKNNTPDATFIWVSARDFYRMGTFGGLSMAYELGRMFAPTIICLEDVDHWLDNYSIDFLKTEMDGIDQSTGVSTLLTTNFPERFPEALIDRPGRFHEVLRIDLPGEEVRARMLAKWVPSASKQAVKEIAKQTDGLSGAHIKELARFAETLAAEQAELGIDEAVKQALKKVIEQREVIASRHIASRKPTATERLSAPQCITFSPVKSFADAASEAFVETGDDPVIVVKGTGDPAPDGAITQETEAVGEAKVVDGNTILQRIKESSHPHDPVTGRPFVDDVDTVAQEGSFRASDMSIEFINVTRRGSDRNRNGSLVQIAEGGGFKGLKTEFWESHKGTWLFGHGLMPGFQMPIGNSFNKKTNRVEFSKTKHRMTSRLFLSQHLPEAAIIAKLLEEGILNCCSVQFLPIIGRELEELEYQVPEGQDPAGLISFGRPLPYEFLEADLFENSVVPIPADAHAIRKGIETGRIGETRIPQSAIQSLRLMAGESAAQSGWTASKSPKRAEFRYYQSIGEHTMEIVAPDLNGAIAMMAAAGMRPPEQATAGPEGNKAQTAQNSPEGQVDYGFLAEQVRQSSSAVVGPTLSATAVQDVIRSEFDLLAERMKRQEDAMRQLTGSLD